MSNHTETPCFVLAISVPLWSKPGMRKKGMEKCTKRKSKLWEGNERKLGKVREWKELEKRVKKWPRLLLLYIIG